MYVNGRSTRSQTQKWVSMNRWRPPSIHQISIALSSLGYILLAAGLIIGWIAPWVTENASFLRISGTLLAAFSQISLIPFSVLSNKIDVNAFLGADITALAVIIAVLIGYNAAALQIAGQLHSLALVQTILWSLLPFLLCWIFTAAVALVYFLIPPTLVAQLLQVLLWFGAVILLMIAYLWDLPWLLSGQHAADLAIKDLRRRPMKQWEGSDGYLHAECGFCSKLGILLPWFCCGGCASTRSGRWYRIRR